MPAGPIRLEAGDTMAYDVFLSYQSGDRKSVMVVQRLLEARGLSAFIDREHLLAGLPWPQALEEALGSVRGVLVFVGERGGGDGLALWQKRETWFALDRQVQEERSGRTFPVIPVLLPGARIDAGFLFMNAWVDLRGTIDDPSAIDIIVQTVHGAANSQRRPGALALCPYRALEAFREEDAPVFFGREAFVSDL